MVVSYKPKSALLQKYIYGFNTFEKGVELKVNYLAFPQLGATLFFVKDAEVKRSETEISISPSANPGFTVEVLGKYTAPISLSYGGFVEEISVDFTPLGINYFFDVPYASLAPNNFQELGVAHWQDFAPQLFRPAETPARLELLEAFLESQFKDPKLDTLPLAVNSLMQADSECSVAQAAANASMSQKTLLRKFNSFVGCSPMLFKRIVRFRNSLLIKRLSRGQHNLTQLGHESLYYDAAHFGREFRLLTGSCPKQFFKDIKLVGHNQYPYLFS